MKNAIIALLGSAVVSTLTTAGTAAVTGVVAEHSASADLTFLSNDSRYWQPAAREKDHQGRAAAEQRENDRDHGNGHHHGGGWQGFGNHNGHGGGTVVPPGVVWETSPFVTAPPVAEAGQPNAPAAVKDSGGTFSLLVLVAGAMVVVRRRNVVRAAA